MRKRFLTDISWNKMHWWQISTGKDPQYHSLITKKLESKTMLFCRSRPGRRNKRKEKLTIPNVGENPKHPELSFISGGKSKWHCNL